MKGELTPSKLIATLVALLSLAVGTEVLAFDCNGQALSAEDQARAVKIVGLEYPLGISFKQWRERTDSAITCELFKRLDIPVDITLMPYLRGFAVMNAGDIDIMQGSDFILDPSARCNFTMLPYRHYDLLAYYYAKERHPREPTRPTDFEGKRIIAMKPKLFESITGLKNVHVTEGQAIAHQFSLLHLGRADYMVALAGAVNQFSESNTGPEEAGRHFKLPKTLQDENVGSIFNVETPFIVADAGLIVNTKRPGMAERVDAIAKSLTEFKQEALYKEIVKNDPRYLGAKRAQAIFSVEHLDKQIAKHCESL